jgi:hypothetical protein
MSFPASRQTLERMIRIAEVRADLSLCLEKMDDLGLALPAIHVDHALAAIESLSTNLEPLGRFWSKFLDEEAC